MVQLSHFLCGEKPFNDPVTLITLCGIIMVASRTAKKDWIINFAVHELKQHDAFLLVDRNDRLIP